MSRFTSAGKIGFTRWSTSSVPSRARTNHVGLISPEVARSSGSDASENASRTAGSGDDSARVIAAHHSRGRAGSSELEVEMREDTARGLGAVADAQHAVAAQPIVLAHLGAQERRSVADGLFRRLL